MEDTKSAKILIVEDEVSLRGILASKLSSLGYEIVTGKDGRDGLVQALETRPDLIILDLIMPIASGLSMLKELRQDEWGKDAQVLVLTNMAISEDAAAAKKLGALDVIVKSNWRMEDIVKKIHEILA